MDAAGAAAAEQGQLGGGGAAAAAGDEEAGEGAGRRLSPQPREDGSAKRARPNEDEGPWDYRGKVVLAPMVRVGTLPVRIHTAHALLPRLASLTEPSWGWL